MQKQIKKIINFLSINLKTTDIILLILTISASLLSLLLTLSLYSFKSISSMRPFIIQIATTIFGFITAIVISNINYHKIIKAWKPIAILACSINLLLFPFGNLRGGNNLSGTETGSDNLNWLNFGFTTIQPSEFLKIAFIITFAFHCSMVCHKINEPKTFIKLIAHTMVPVLIIFLQKDYGTMLIFIFIAACMIFISGINWKFITITAGVSLLLLTIFLTTVISDFRLKRFVVLGDLEKFKDGEGFQQYRGIISLASGKIFGKGFFSDNMLNAPELYNDMIFAHIGQTMGFIGCTLILIWFVTICVRILQHGKNSQDNLGYLICVGCFAVFFIQTIINISMVLRIAPVIGINLPFLSNGGSSNLTNYIILGLILSVQKHSFKPTLF